MSAIPSADLLRARDTARDVGTEITADTEYQRTDIVDVVTANTKRFEQALRAMEEYGKILSPELAKSVERLRYAAYDAAKQLGAHLYRSQQLATARLYLLLDGHANLDTFVALAEQAIAAGAQIVQLRDKQLRDRELLARARALRQITRGRALFVMNDRPDIAALADADGVHVGQDELTVTDARRVVGPRCLIGVSTHSIEQARQAVCDGADYIGCGPTFPSTTKTFSEFPGIDYLQQVAAEIRIPAFAIGGITLENLNEVRRAGIARIAVSSAITQATDVAAAVRAFRTALGE